MIGKERKVSKFREIVEKALDESDELKHVLSQFGAIPERKDNALTYYIRSFADWFNSSPMLYTIYWRAGIYNVLIMWGFVYLLIH